MTYEYLCTACGYQWEAEQAISEKALKDCPQCKKASAKRQISGGTGFLLKGGGWYADGYGSSSASANSGASSSDSAPGGSASSSGDASAGSNSKPAPKSEAAAVKSDTAPAAGSKPSTPSNS